MPLRSDNADWSFVRRPFWLFSHAFAFAVITTFVFLGLWQGDRHRERADLNELIEARANPPAVDVDEALEGDDPSQLEYRYVSAMGTFVDGDFVRVANRSQGGIAGEHVVALFELDDGRILLVNRGFVPLDTPTGQLDPTPTGRTTLTGWLRLSAERGWIGAADTGSGNVVPRLDVDAIAQRLDRAPDATTDGSVMVPLALQAEGSDEPIGSAPAPVPNPVPLPPIDGGPHLSYMVQWFIFATLGFLFYGALLWRTAHGHQRQAPTPELVAEPIPETRRSDDRRPVGS